MRSSRPVPVPRNNTATHPYCRALLVPPEGPGWRVDKAGCDPRNVPQPLPGTLVAECEVFGGDSLRGLGRARRSFDQQPYLRPTTPGQEPASKPCLPGAEDVRDRELGLELVRGQPAHRGQDIGGPGGGDQADGCGGQRAEGLMELGHAQLGVLMRCQAGELAGERPAYCRPVIVVLLVAV